MNAPRDITQPPDFIMNVEKLKPMVSKTPRPGLDHYSRV